MKACVKILGDNQVEMEFPDKQSCCGLPVQMMGEKKAARDVAIQNLRAFQKGNYDYVVTLCASCASHLKHSYPKLVAGDPQLESLAMEFSRKVIDYSSFVHDVLKVSDDAFRKSNESATYHAPCHLCRGLDVHDAPRDLIKTAGLEYRECDEEEVCCGFGGTFSMKFPELSSELLRKKLDNVEATGADILLTDCPGCIMQLRGGLRRRGSKVQVKHVAEVMAENKK
jgi:Fe-S oxidoreductase